MRIEDLEEDDLEEYQLLGSPNRIRQQVARAHRIPQVSGLRRIKDLHKMSESRSHVQKHQKPESDVG